jgi:hypothetical protein
MITVVYNRNIYFFSPTNICRKKRPALWPKHSHQNLLKGKSAVVLAFTVIILSYVCTIRYCVHSDNYCSLKIIVSDLQRSKYGSGSGILRYWHPDPDQNLGSQIESDPCGSRSVSWSVYAITQKMNAYSYIKIFRIIGYKTSRVLRLRRYKSIFYRRIRFLY